MHNVRGYLPLKVVHFIMNMRTTFRPFFLTRHGQSEYNEVGRIGGDSGLSTHGVAYARWGVVIRSFHIYYKNYRYAFCIVNLQTLSTRT